MFKNIYCLAICLLYQTLILTTFTNASESNAIHQNHRLPKTLSPVHYKVQVLTNLGDVNNDQNFSGTVWIKIYCNESTQNIVLHSKNLTVPSSEIELFEEDGSDGGRKMQLDESSYDTENEFLIIPSKVQLQKGKMYRLKLNFNADLSDSLLGYYRSSYYDITLKKTKWLSTTQFEAIYARRAFPCFDEPNFKAKFEIILGHNKKFNALSNMPIKSTTPIDGKPDWVWDHFEETVPMSTYLVAYSINDFDHREAIVQLADRIIKFRVWARRDAIDQVDYALTVGPIVLKFYEKYFDLGFPLPKMDMIAIPDFSAGAMENWGLITYRETALLYHPNISSSSGQHRVAEVIAHELAHQWFGNLVTMKWWTDLWLNEGFATYVATLGVSHVHPEWNSLTEEYVEQMSSIFDFDSLRNSHPVSIEIGNPSEISQIFDTISYKKGSGVIRMMHGFLGEEPFRIGVSNYLKKHEYDNAEQDDLWQSLTDEAHKQGTLDKSITVKEIMDKWTLQTGFPLLTVTREHDKNTISVTQKRYLMELIKGPIPAEDEDCWSVPISFTTSSTPNFNDTMPKAWLKCNDNRAIPQTINGLSTTSNKWYILNVQLSAIYKVNYDESNWMEISNVLNNASIYDLIDSTNRAQIIIDALDLAFVGELAYPYAIRVIGYLMNNEKEYIPWSQALTKLNEINKLLKWSPDFAHFKRFVKNLIGPIYQKINPFSLLDGDQHMTDFSTAKHKALIASWACRFNIGDCLSRSKEAFNEWMETENPDESNSIPADLRPTIYCNAIRHGDEVQWDFLWQRYNNSNVAAEKIIILSALGCSREIWILQRYLSYILEPNSGVRKQDATQVFGSIARNENGFQHAKDFLFRNIAAIHDYFKPDISRIGRLISPIASSTMTPELRQEFKGFVDKNSKLLEKASKAVEQGLEKIDINIEWHKKRYADLTNVLKMN